MRVSKGMVAVLCLLGLSACASHEEKTAYVAPERIGNSSPIVTDDAYVAAVERQARRRGIYLQWVNMPTKRVAQE